MSSTLMTEIVPEHAVPGRTEAIKPPRLNFGRRCIYCLKRDCDTPRCEALYEQSRWAICPECDGREGDGMSGLRCAWCTFGVVEVAAIRADGPNVDDIEGPAERQ